MEMLSGDGYIRMKFESFQQTEIVHLISGMDDDRPATSGIGANATAITGYTRVDKQFVASNHDRLGLEIDRCARDSTSRS